MTIQANLTPLIKSWIKKKNKKVPLNSEKFKRTLIQER
jgi:hypothetical protein